MKYIKLASFTLTLCVSSFTCLANDALTSDVFSLGKIKMGTTTIGEAVKMLGPSKYFRLEKEDESPLAVCYAVKSSGGYFYLTLESGASGGFKRIDGFSISKSIPAHECGYLQSDLDSVLPANGVEIGESRAHFEKRFKVKFSRHGNDLLYESEGKRDPN